MSTNSPERIVERLTRERLRSYLRACGQDLDRAIELYDWNVAVAAALHADLGRFEVVFRNALDGALGQVATSRGWPDPWERHPELFPGRGSERTRADIHTARKRATRSGKLPEVHGKVIAELNFGFWRYLCAKQHLTTLWVPALAGAFPSHPTLQNARVVRADVERRVQGLLFVRNRIAHHEPIHQRDLHRDFEAIIEVTGWMGSASHDWIRDRSRVTEVLRSKPR